MNGTELKSAMLGGKVKSNSAGVLWFGMVWSRIRYSVKEYFLVWYSMLSYGEKYHVASCWCGLAQFSLVDYGRYVVVCYSALVMVKSIMLGSCWAKSESQQQLPSLPFQPNLLFPRALINIPTFSLI